MVLVLVLVLWAYGWSVASELLVLVSFRACSRSVLGFLLSFVVSFAGLFDNVT